MARKPGKWKARGLTVWDVRYAIVEDLKKDELSLEQIAAKHEVSFGMVRNANEGRSEWVKKLEITHFPMRERYYEKISRVKDLLKQSVLDEEVAKATGLELVEVVRVKLKMLEKGDL